MSEKLKELHDCVLATEYMLKRVAKMGDAKSADLENVARQFLKDNNIDTVQIFKKNTGWTTETYRRTIP